MTLAYFFWGAFEWERVQYYYSSMHHCSVGCNFAICRPQDGGTHAQL